MTTAECLLLMVVSPAVKRVLGRSKWIHKEKKKKNLSRFRSSAISKDIPFHTKQLFGSYNLGKFTMTWSKCCTINLIFPSFATMNFRFDCDYLQNKENIGINDFETRVKNNSKTIFYSYNKFISLIPLISFIEKKNPWCLNYFSLVTESGMFTASQ